MSPTHTPDVAGSLIAELEQGGELVDAGKFSIDARQALTKLREYQLVDPHAWVLLAIEAAVLAGVERVVVPAEGEITIDLGSLTVSADELEQLFAWVFVELEGLDDPTERLRRRALQQLALASNAVLGLAPRELIVESIDPQRRGARLRMTRDRPLGLLESLTDAAPGTRIRVEGLTGERERALIRERCRYTTHDIRIGDERISRGPAGAIVDAELEGMREQGFAPSARTKPLVDAQGRTVGRHGKAYRTTATPSLLIVSSGVLIERIELDAPEQLEPTFVAVVELDLPRDLSQAKVRRGPELDAILAAARRAAMKPSERAPAGRLSPLDLASGEGVGLRVLYILMAGLGSVGGVVAFAIVLAGARGALPWCLGLTAIGLTGIAMLRRTAQ